MSIKEGKFNAFKALFENGAKCVFYRGSTAEQTVFHYAAYFGRIEIIRYLITQKFNITAIVPALQKTGLTFALEEKKWPTAARILMSQDTMESIAAKDKLLIQDNLDNIYQAYAEERNHLPKELPLNVMHLLILTPACTHRYINFC
ncbi:ankyrin repeat domain-containing protein [Legionella maceachernii]|uniref:ankyrin repeat domain-containing protein n=1 Tax=Legionella maceachernii TaxID=466 RepID=UPI003076FD63